MAALAAVLYLVNLTISGYANTYYSMAAQAASQSWSAWFFGSLDAGNFITLDKPPLASMLMGLSVRLFGLSPLSILLPQALMGVGTVVFLFLAVRRSFGVVAAAIAGVVMALTPVAVLIFRYNNPDALLTFLLVVAAWAVLRALDAGRIRWLVLAATLTGLAFNTKFLQGWLMLPAFALAWTVAAPGGWRRRIAGLAASAAVVAATSLAWVAAVELIPAASRPIIGGSTTNSALDLLLGYDGLGRIFGATGNPNGGGGGMFGGASGILRLFNSQFAGEIAWLLPFALVAFVSGLWLRGRAPRTDAPRVGYLLWGAWLGVNGLVFSLMSGIIHPYYSVVLAPAIAALVGAGIVTLWRLRERSIVGGLVLGAGFLAAGVLAMDILDRTPAFAPGLGIGVLAVSAAAAMVVALPAAMSGRRAALAATCLGLAAALAGPVAYGLDTMGSAISGGDPAAGPIASGLGGGGAGGPGGGTGGPAGFGGGAGGQAANARGGAPTGMDGASADASLIAYLEANRGSTTWLVAVSGSSQAAAIQLATGQPVMAMGGFNGSDAAPTLAQLQAYVADGRLRYVMVSGNGGGGGGPMGAGGSSSVSSWVTSACTAVDTGSSNGSLYDCSGATVVGG